jgi:hypothetical protein
METSWIRRQVLAGMLDCIASFKELNLDENDEHFGGEINV